MNLPSFVRNNWRSPSVITVAVLGTAMVWFAGSYLWRGDEQRANADLPKEVRVAKVKDILREHSYFTATVSAVNEAKVTADAGGRISRVSAAIGDFVGAGQILAEIENGVERAAVLQAEGALDAARAALEKVKGGTRDEQLAILTSAADTAKRGAIAILFSAFSAFDSAVRDTSDQMFSNPGSPLPQFNVTTSNTQAKIDLQNARVRLEEILKRQSRSAEIDAASDVLPELETTESELRELRAFLDTLLIALADATPSSSISTSDIAGFKTGATAARGAVNGSLSAIASARGALRTAQENLKQGVVGAQTEDVAGAEAAEKQARGAYNAAVAILEKKIIRSPIGGNLTNFAAKLGDTIAPSQDVAIVSNRSALQAIASISEEQAAQLRIGMNVVLEGTEEGVVTKIAPALDPVTRRIAITIGLPASAREKYSDGESVRVTREDDTEVAQTGVLSIPLTAIKLQSDRAIVFTVVDQKLVAREIAIGRLSGASVQVERGLDPDLEIVVDARGLNEGETVTVRLTP